MIVKLTSQLKDEIYPSGFKLDLLLNPLRDVLSVIGGVYFLACYPR